ncbi:hypothetical protein ACJMK2_012528 [Sinanodonta woodiana]|uniref:Uncharacterized protein n=1 Tax=Sinanodonta woodiana TaxID=1069815 RepID=A0ABD3VAU1_SINWO
MAQTSHDVVSSDFSNRNNSVYQAARQNYVANLRYWHREQELPHRCPSCEGARGSSPSSFDSVMYPNPYSGTQPVRQNPPCHDPCRPEVAYSRIHNSCNVHLANSSYVKANHTFRPVLHTDNSSRHSSVLNSGYHYFQSHSHVPVARVPPTTPIKINYQKQNFYFNPQTCVRPSDVYLAGAAAQECESDPDSTGSLRNVSIVARYGSSSSESLECSCTCGHCSSHCVDSNRSTFGSSEIKVSSDDISCDSLNYRELTKDEEAQLRESLLPLCQSEGHWNVCSKGNTQARHVHFKSHMTADFVCSGSSLESVCTDTSSAQLSDSEDQHQCQFCDDYNFESSDMSLSDASDVSVYLSDEEALYVKTSQGLANTQANLNSISTPSLGLNETQLGDRCPQTISDINSVMKPYQRFHSPWTHRTKRTKNTHCPVSRHFQSESLPITDAKELQSNFRPDSNIFGGANHSELSSILGRTKNSSSGKHSCQDSRKLHHCYHGCHTSCHHGNHEREAAFDFKPCTCDTIVSAGRTLDKVNSISSHSHLTGSQLCSFSGNENRLVHNNCRTCNSNHMSHSMGHACGQTGTAACGCSDDNQQSGMRSMVVFTQPQGKIELF